MPEIVAIENVPLEQTTQMLRGQVILFQAYALALAQKAGLTPEAAGHYWFEFLGDPVRPPRPRAGPVDVERVARAVAGFYQAMFPQTQLEREGDTWTMRSVLTHDKPDLERWGASLQFFTRWAAAVGRLEGKASGDMTWETWQDGDTVYTRLGPNG